MRIGDLNIKRIGAVVLLLITALLLTLVTGYMLGRVDPPSAHAEPRMKAEESTPNAALTEAERRFTYRRKPIHPALVEGFAGFLSDPARPSTISVDVAAAHNTNEYHEPIEVDGDWVRYRPDDTPGSFSYRWLGRLHDGTHVLRTAEHGGGSGVFIDLMLVRFDAGRGYEPKTGRYDRLLMSVVGQITLGDRSRARVTVTPERLVIRNENSEQPRRVIRAEQLPRNERTRRTSDTR